METQHSFLNSLVGGLTFGILTPISIKVTCATSGRAELPAGAPRVEVGSRTPGEGVRDVFAEAARVAVETEQAVYVMF